MVIFDSQKFLEERKKKCTQAQLAERADTSIRYIHDLERGIKRNPSASMVYRISISLDAPMESFMKVVDDPEQF